MNLFDRFVALFSSPSEAFEGLVESPLAASQIILSITITLLAVGVMSFWIISQPDIKREIIASESAKIQKQVTDGQLSQQTADERVAGMETFFSGPMGTVISVISPVLMTIIFFFLFSLYFLLTGKFFGSEENYTFSVSMSLIAIVFILSSVFSLVSSSLMVFIGSISASFGPVLLIEEFNPNNALHKLAYHSDLLNWVLIYFYIAGFKITSKSSWLKSALIVLIPYFLYVGYKVFM